eukprot:TRINITY_DN8712_c0_g1_i1.p1 TRINITY_DN8712_c0_g1~~TRINITY_DN8712_c0_g1_i1.p1  ORF type:complete len:529 (+),score=113.26 TRINITY_DN8712_c0_g1_i1:71-1588(+)
MGSPLGDGYFRWPVHTDQRRKVNFDLPESYEVTGLLGSGTFGVVVACEDRDTGRSVAVKRVPIRQYAYDEAQMLIRELRVLRHFSGHPNLLGITTVVRPRGPEHSELYLVTPRMAQDLLALLTSQPSYFDSESVPLVMYDVLQGLYALHSAGVVHRDLKPSNVLVSEQGVFRISDFGSSRNDASTDKTAYVCTRNYRAPELLLREQYTKAVDIWSAGCIFGQLLARSPLPILPSKHTNEDARQLLCNIFELIGHDPDDEQFREWVQARAALQFIREQPRRPPRSPAELFPDPVPVSTLQLLFNMLRIHPSRRPEAQHCLAHQYFGENRWRTEADAQGWPAFDATFERMGQARDVAGRMQNAHKLLNLEVCLYHPDLMGADGYDLPDALRPTVVDGSAAEPDWDPSAEIGQMLSALDTRGTGGADGPSDAELAAIVTAPTGRERRAVDEALFVSGVTVRDGQVLAEVTPETAVELSNTVVLRLRAHGFAISDASLSRDGPRQPSRP